MKKLNFQLLKAIIKTDFFLLEFQKPKNLKFFELNFNKNFSILNILDLNLYLKQFIRLLQFVKKQKINILILDSKIQYLSILKKLFLKNKNIIQNVFLFNERVSTNSLLKPHYEIYIDKKERKQDFLISQINSKVEITNMGVYKIFNSLNSFKKLLFFAAVIQNVLKNFKKNAITKKI